MTTAVLAGPPAAPIAGAAVLGVLRQQGAHTAGRAEHEHGVAGFDLRVPQYPHDSAAGADQGDGLRRGHVPGDGLEGRGVGDGQFGVAAGCRAEMDGDAPAEPAGVGPLAQQLDSAGDFAARDGGQVWQRQRADPVAAAERGVDQVHARCLHGDPDLAGSGYRIGDFLVRQVLGGAEGVQTDGVHGARSFADGPAGVRRGRWPVRAAHAAT